jgi:hypothetical protein
LTSDTNTRSLTMFSVIGKVGSRARPVKAKKCAGLSLPTFRPFV